MSSGGRETPEPPGFAVGAPTGFVGVEHARVHAAFANRVGPRSQDAGESMPDFGQPALGKFHPQVAIEHGEDLTRRRAETVMQPRRQRHRAVPQRAGRQRIRHFRLDLLLATRAPIAFDRVFGDFAAGRGGQVFDDPFAFATGAF